MLFPDTTVGARPAALVFLAGHRVLQAAGDVDRGESAESEQDAADNGNDSGDDAGDGESLRPTFCERKVFWMPRLVLLVFFCSMRAQGICGGSSLHCWLFFVKLPAATVRTCSCSLVRV